MHLLIGLMVFQISCPMSARIELAFLVITPTLSPKNLLVSAEGMFGD
jgi:hypothetical protein